MLRPCLDRAAALSPTSTQPPRNLPAICPQSAQVRSRLLQLARAGLLSRLQLVHGAGARGAPAPIDTTELGRLHAACRGLSAHAAAQAALDESGGAAPRPTLRHIAELVSEVARRALFRAARRAVGHIWLDTCQVHALCNHICNHIWLDTCQVHALSIELHAAGAGFVPPPVTLPRASEAEEIP